jgi:4a-hydroxytetrahydrobiopterin dehydratase
MARPSAFSAPQLLTQLAALPQWQLHGDGPTLAIQRVFVFDSYLATMAFANAVAYLSERIDHHPDMLLQYQRCTVRWRTHEPLGITVLDIQAAQQVDALFDTGADKA